MQAINGWLMNKSGERIGGRAAEACDSYQQCELNAARILFASGW
jgi:hypothetical protein